MMKRKQTLFPLRFGKGTQRVSLYAPTTALPYYRLAYRMGGKRLQRTFKSLEKAKQEAAAIAGKLASGEVTVAEVTASEVVQLRAAQEQLSSMQVRIDTAASQYANAIGRLGKVKLDEAVEFYLRHHCQQMEEIDVPLLLERFLAFKQTSGVSKAYQSDLRNRTRSLAQFHLGAVNELTPELMAEYFKKLNFASVHHNNQLRVIHTLVNFAQSQGYLPDTIDLLKAVSRKKTRKASYPIYQPHEFEALLDGANDEMIPPLILLGFCGVRPNEMRRLNWRDIRFESRTLVIDAINAKTASRRTVPLCEAALGWLREFKGSDGPIWGRKSDYWSKALSRLHRKVGVKQLPNALRHSYISYRLTLTGDVNRTALEAGNSAAMIHSNYHALVEDPRFADDWFELGMEGEGEVIRVAVI